MAKIKDLNERIGDQKVIPWRNYRCFNKVYEITKKWTVEKKEDYGKLLVVFGKYTPGCSQIILDPDIDVQVNGDNYYNN